MLSAINGVAASVPTILYMWALLRMSHEHWIGFWESIGAVFPLAVLGTRSYMRKLLGPLYQCLDRWAQGAATPEDVRAAYHVASSMPQKNFATGVLWFFAGGVLVTCGVWIRFPDFQPFSALVMISGVVSTGFVVLIFNFFAMQRILLPVRERLGREIPDAAERRALILVLPLARKLRVALLGSTIAIVFFVALLAIVRAGRPVELFVLRSQGVLLEGLVNAHPAALASALEDARKTAEKLGVGDAVVILDPERAKIVDGEPDALASSEIDRILASAQGGTSEEVDGSHVYRWAALPDGRIAVLVVGWSHLNAGMSSVVLVCVLSIALAVAISFAIAGYIGRDVEGAARAVRRAAERIAQGDLSGSEIYETEDELGDIARSFSAMTAALRLTIGRVAATADRVEAAASDIASASESVASVTAEQVRGIQSATGAMETVSNQMTGIAEAAEGLNLSVEESSASILELGSAGDELNRTASLLSGKVEEASSAIEQMIGSVRQVTANVDTLADAAEGTSSSMEQMASSLRDVDSNAGETAKLSSRVVASAEVGRERVQQTIVGMTAIHETTETAEHLIRSLGERAKEIGAIVDVIDDVADETNLLALNAAIIAAQAGEHGRAFSVVADQIKDLADRVLASTKEIAGLIRSVQGETQNAIAAVEQGARTVQEGVDMSAEAGLALEEITTAARESGMRISEIVNAVREQARAASHVVGLMEKVRQGVDKIREAGHEQKRGNDAVHRSTVSMRDAALQMHGTAEEQARGSARIRETISVVRDAAERINASLQDQSEGCRRALGTLEQVADRTRSNEESSKRLEEAMRGLRREAETLRQDVRRFRTEEEGGSTEAVAGRIR
jgi:methyl-accepting chemotaxis protein